MPHQALLDKWLQIGCSGSPADDRIALEFIRAAWGHRGYDAWTREAEDGLPPFVLIAEGEPRRLAVGYLRFASGTHLHSARRGAMAMLRALENLLKREQRELGVLIAADEIQARRLVPALPPIELLVDCVLSPEAPPVFPEVKRIPWNVKDAGARPMDQLAAELSALLTA
jgi:hypothetical protein